MREIIAGPSGLASISLLKEDSILDKGKTAKKFSEVMTSGIRFLHVEGSDYLSFKGYVLIVAARKVVCQLMRYILR